MNKVILAGRLGRDPEMRSTATGDQVASFSMATGTKEYTQWHNVVAFKKKADLIGRFLKKGSQVIVDGELQTRKWQGKDGTDRYTTEVIVREIHFIDGRGTDSKDDQDSSQNEYSSASTATIDDEDIPF